MKQKTIKLLKKNKKAFKDMSSDLQNAAIQIGKPNFLFWHNFDHERCEQHNGLVFSPNYSYKLRADY